MKHVVQDGGSTDSTLEILERLSTFPELDVRVESDNGQSDALNRAFRRCTGDIIGWMNADDLYPPGVLHRVGEFFARNPGVMAVHGDCELIDSDGATFRRLIGEEVTVEKLLSFQYVVGGTAYFFRRSVLERIGYLDESLHYAMDYDLWMRISLTCETRYIPHVLAQFRIHPASKTGKGFVDTFLPEIRTVMRRYRSYGAGPVRRFQRWAAEGRYASHLLWEAAWDAHREHREERARTMARAAGMAWLPSIGRYHRAVEFFRGCLRRG